ncbi:outer membrane protein assembly factor BamB family protein [Nonomuraea sp. KM90]|uniref:outer membrane protein assembly factor BamB family protein n=1 Tax=Nonomuraea sp. KM90 TaxID=3457428 RepID=UPI003FCD1614
MIGQTLWERQLHQPGMASRAAATVGRVVVHERHTRLVCLNRHDGSVRWDRPVGGWPRAVVVAGDCCLVLPQDKAQLSCLDLATGVVRWSAGLREFTGHVVASGSTVVVGGWRGYTPLAAFDLADGRLLWRTPQRMATVRPATFGDGVLLGSGSAAWLIDPRDGRELARWRTPEPLKEMDGTRAFTMIDSERCLVRCGSRSVALVRLSSELVDQVFGHDSDLLDWPPEFTGGVVWLAERGARYLAVDPEAGSVLWRVDVGQPLARGVLRDGEGFIMASQGGVLLRLGPDGEPLERSSSGTTRVAGLRGIGAGEALMLTKGTLRMIALGSSLRRE